MKLLKENGMLDLDILEDVIWHLRMSDIERLKQPTEDGICTIHPVVWIKNKNSVKLLRQTLIHVRDTCYAHEYLYERVESKENKIERLENKIKQLTEEKESVEMENVNLRTKIQEAQVTAGLFIQSVKDKLPDWFSKKDK